MTKTKAKSSNTVISLLPIKVTLTRKQARTLIAIAEDYEQVCDDYVTVRSMTAIKKKLMAALGWGDRLVREAKE